MIDNKTERLELPLPNIDNYLEQDVARLSDALRILDEKVATVGGNGKIPVEQLPAVALTDTFPVASQEEMLLLNAQPGDVAIRSDVSKSFILMTAPASVLGNWKELLNNGFNQVKDAIAEVSGNLTGIPENTPVPSHSNPDLGPALNLQAQALLNRTEKLNQSTLELGQSIQSTALSEAAAVTAGIRNRSTVKFLSCPPTANNGGQLLTMQSFWIDPIKNEVWLSYDNSDRTRQVVERRKFNGTVVSSDVYTGVNSVGHLDGFHVNSDDSVFCTDKYTNPSVLRIKSGAILERMTYSLPTQGNQILAVDRSFSDRFVILTKDTSGILRIYTGLFSEAVSGVLQLKDTGIAVPQSETVQGVAVLYDRVYMLTGDGGLLTSKYLYEWRIADGTLVAKLPHNPNRLYADTDYSANSREPEGLNVIFEGLHNEQQVQIYSGVLFADFSASVVHNVIFKHSPAVARSHVPTFNGWVGRADGAEQFRPVQHCILFRKVSGSWKVWDGNLESYLSRSLVTRVVAGGSSNKGLIFDLANSYQALIGVTITCNSGLRQAAGAEVFWTEKAGGSNSRFNHKINFLRVSDNVYLDADDASIPDGSWISLSLMVAM